MEKPPTASDPALPGLPLRRVVWIYFLIMAATYGLPILFGLSWLPSPGFPASTPPLPRFHHGYDNFSFPHFHLPYRHLAMDSIARGELPLWNPYNWVGVPMPAQYEVQLLSPLEWLDWLGGPLWWNILLVLKIWAAALGTFLLVRALVGEWAGFASGLLYMFSSFLVGFNTMEAFFNHAVILPWMFYLAWLAFNSQVSWPGLLGAGGALFGLCVTTGQPQIAALNLGGLAVFTIGQILLNLRPKALLRGLGILVGAGLLGVLCGSLQLAFFHEAMGTGYTIHPAGAYGGGGTAPLNFALPLMPLTFGQLMAPWLALYPHRLNPEALPLILGIGGMLLTCAGLVGLLFKGSGGPGRRRQIIPFVLLAAAVLGLIIAGTLGHGNLWTHPAVNRINLPRYSGPLLSLCFGVIGGFGFARLLEGKWKYLAGVGCLASAIVLTHQVVIWPYLNLPLSEGVNAGYRSDSILLSETLVALSLLACLAVLWLAKTPAARLALLLVVVAELAFYVRYGFAMRTELWRLLVCGLVFVAGALWARDLRRPALIAVASSIILLGVLLWGAPHRLAPRRNYAAQQHPAIAFLQAQLGPGSVKGRVLSSQGIMIPDALATFGIAEISGLNPVQIDTVAQFFRQAVAGRDINYTLPVAWRGLANGSGGDWLTWEDYLQARPLFNQLNVRFLIDRNKGELSRVDWPGLQKVFSDTQYAIYEDLQAHPRAFFVPAEKILPADSLADALAKVAENRARPDEWLVVESPALPTLPTAAATVTSPEVTITGYSPTRVSLRATTGAAGCVVLTEAVYPGWQASLNGVPAEILRTQGMVRAVAVGPGTHAIDFTYHPGPLRIWLPASLAGWLVSLGLAVDGFLRRQPSAPRVV